MRKLLQRIGIKRARCTHRDAIRDVAIVGSECSACVAQGDTWVHLRICMTCGEVGCCDASKNKHARRHAEEVGHPIVRSLHPDESWMWCFVDADFVASS